MNKQKLLYSINRLSNNTLMQTLNIEFIDVTEDSLTAKMPVNTSVHQPFGLLHGGATAALAETVGSSASALFVDNDTKIVKGIELNISHLKSVKEGFVYGIAKSIHKGKTIHLEDLICRKDLFQVLDY